MALLMENGVTSPTLSHNTRFIVNEQAVIVETEIAPVFKLTPSTLGFTILWPSKWPEEYIACADTPWMGSESLIFRGL